MPRYWRRVPLAHVQPEIGFVYTARTGHPQLSSHKRPSAAVVLENGVPLPGPATALHEDIRKLDAGVFPFGTTMCIFRL